MKQIRHDKIIQMLEEKRKITIEELQEELQISVETIRRDLNTLEGAGFLKRVYGGAVLTTALGVEPEYAKRAASNIIEKTAIAQRVADMIQDGDTIALDLGTTTQEVAKLLTHKSKLTVLTNSLLIAQLLSASPSNQVYMLGGLVRPGENTTAGPLCIEGLERFRVDKAVIGLAGISLMHGVTDFVEAEAEARKKMIEIASYVIAVADYSKFGVTAFCTVCSLDDLDVLVTDWNTPKATVEAMRNRSHLQVLVADKP